VIFPTKCISDYKSINAGLGTVKTSNIPENLDDLIDQEKRSLAKEYFADAWAEVQVENLGTDLVAEVFIQEIIERLAIERGSEEASKLIKHFKNLDEMGILPLQRTLQ